MEVQLTDFENAAFTVFVVLLSRVILYFNLNFYMPISCVDCNMRRAHQRDAINTQKFMFRNDPMPEAHPRSHKTPVPQRAFPPELKQTTAKCCGSTSGVEEFSLHEIMTGKGAFKGLVRATAGGSAQCHTLMPHPSPHPQPTPQCHPPAACGVAAPATGPRPHMPSATADPLATQVPLILTELELIHTDGNTLSITHPLPHRCH